MKTKSEYKSILALLPGAVGWDNQKVNEILKRCETENKELYAFYPMFDKTNVSNFEFIGEIEDGALYLKPNKTRHE